MRKKKVILAISSVLFAFIIIFSVFSVFTVKQVKTVFAVTENSVIDVNQIQKAVNKSVGSNLVFYNTNAIDNSLKELSFYPYIEIVSVEKQFPNNIFVNIKERREVYIVEYESKSYVTTEDGFVLSEFSNQNIGEHNYIKLKLTGKLNLTNVESGKYIQCNDMDSLRLAYDLAKSVDLTDCIKEMTVDKREGTGQIGSNQLWVTFNTYTAVDIVIMDAGDMGREKTTSAFRFYDMERNDYIKSFNTIEAYKSEGQIVVRWTSH